MSFPIASRALLRGMLAGAVVLTGAACSRTDRAKSGPGNPAAVATDTSGNAAQPSDTGTVTGAVNDTATSSDRSSTSAQPTTPAPSNAPRAETAAPGDKDAAGYRSMERDTTTPSNQHSDSARVTADSAVSQAVPGTSDSATELSTSNSADTSSIADPATVSARDTSTVADQADTAAANGDVALRATVDTTKDATADVSAEAGAADSAGNADRIRPAEDSTEILGNVTTNEGDETADEQVVRPEDRATVAASETAKDEVGAAAIGGEVTGAQAVTLMTREGLRCTVVDTEENQEVRWDMSSTPVSLNPCGMGSMILSRIWTEK